jgi:hypothetical protein
MENKSPTLQTPMTSPTQLRNHHHHHPTTDQTHTLERLNSPSQADKYTTIQNILQAGVAALETIDNPNTENTPKDVISLIKFISHKLTNNDVMLHIILTSEKLLTNQCLLRYTAAAIFVTTADFAVNAATASIIAVTAAAVYVASTVSAILDIATVSAVLDVAAIFTVSATAVIVTDAVSTTSTTTAIFTATAAVSVYSTSTSDRSPHLVSSVRLWSYHPLAPFPQSVMNT